MEDLPILLLFLSIYLIAASSGSNKKKRGKKNAPVYPGASEQRSAMRTQVQDEQADWRAVLRTQQVQRGFDEAFAAHGPEEEACESQPIHLHTAGQSQMMRAGEGEDPCHAGGYMHSETPEETDTSAQEQTRSALAQDVLRGVIMSEILTRPHERQYAARRQKGYHG